MHIKFLKHGRGSAQRAVAYLLAEKDHQGLERTGVEVLRGDPRLVASVAEALPFAHRYSSGVVSWSAEEQPTEEEIEGVLEDLGQAFTAGFDDPSRVAWTAILHRESHGSCHLHVLVARVDLATGKSYNPAPPGWQRTFDALRDAWNWEKGWARPDDPLRARTLQKGHLHLLEASALRAERDYAEDPKAVVHRYLVQRIENGLIRNRREMVEALEEAGLLVPRQGKDYLTVQDPETGARYRLKGAIYGADFTPEACRELGRALEPEDRGRRERGGVCDGKAARRARAAFEQRLEVLAAYRHRRYRIPAPEASPPQLEPVGVDAALGDSPRDRYRGPEPVRLVEVGAPAPSGGRASEDRSADPVPASSVPGEADRRDLVSDRAPDRPEYFDLQRTRRRKRGRRQTDPLKEDSHERDRAALTEGLGRLERACGGLGAAIGAHDEELRDLIAADRGLVAADRSDRVRAERVDRAARDFAEAADRLGRAITAIRTAAERILAQLAEQVREMERKRRGPDLGF